MKIYRTYFKIKTLSSHCFWDALNSLYHPSAFVRYLYLTIKLLCKFAYNEYLQSKIIKSDCKSAISYMSKRCYVSSNGGHRFMSCVV